MSTEKQEVLAALQDVNWPGSDQSLEQQDRIGAVELEDAELVVEVNLTGLDRAQRHQLEDEITKRLSAQFDNVEICLDVSSDDVAAPVANSEAKPQQGMPTMYDAGKREAPAEAVVTPKKTALSEVKNIIGVASGKGGLAKVRLPRISRWHCRLKVRKLVSATSIFMDRPCLYKWGSSMRNQPFRKITKSLSRLKLTGSKSCRSVFLSTMTPL